ncbi:type II toxin-antitoxin system PemK/MazF family toxin [Pseudoramibacter faecis]|uniref:type II toxin-antitoxin system PemK/MazF family toxin n=1 Tax=Pseudoramibacter faecis TaxID=3108534 RepID=UPI002E75B999|nr:type II toxin-antitoxin system PemK/MazF family toxin [Pseudoramibacter sp. HA2172]
MPQSQARLTRGQSCRPTALFGTDYGLELPSVILLEQIRTLDKKRLEKFAGSLEEKHLRELNRALVVSIGLSKPPHQNLVLCLCKLCADNFRMGGKYDLARASENQERNTCTYCNHRMGHEYELIARD